MLTFAKLCEFFFFFFFAKTFWKLMERNLANDFYIAKFYNSEIANFHIIPLKLVRENGVEFGEKNSPINILESCVTEKSKIILQIMLIRSPNFTIQIE